MKNRLIFNYYQKKIWNWRVI